MYKEGHIGLAFIFAAPIAIIVSALISPIWGMIFMGLSFITCKVPDFDQRFASEEGENEGFIKHRGFTHTIWFGIIISGILSIVSINILGIQTNPGQETEIIETFLGNWIELTIIFSGLLTGFISHLFGDILTEAYTYTVNPFWPISNKAYTLGWTKSGNRIWNYGLLIGGIISLGIVFAISLSIM